MTSSTDFTATDSITGSISGDSATVDSITTYAGGINSVSFNRGANQVDWQNPTLFSSGDITVNTANGNEWINLTQQSQGMQINKRPDGGSGGKFIRLKDNSGAVDYGSIYGAGDDIVLFRDGGTNDNIITINRSSSNSDNVTIGTVPLIVSDLSGTGNRLVYADPTGQLIEGNDSSDVVQSNFSASADPLSTDDSSAGYSVGSMWYNTADSVVWTAVDVTVGSAVWEQTLHGVFVPSGNSSDVAGFTAYAQRQVDSGQPIYLYSPNRDPFEFDGGLTNSGVYCSAPWIGIGRGTSVNGPVEIRWSGTNTVLAGSGMSGLKFTIANGSTTTIQGYSNHTKLDLAELEFETGTTVTQFNFEVINVFCSRIYMVSGVNNTALTIGNRSNVFAQNVDINNATCSIEISSDSRLNTLQGDGTIRVGYDGGVSQNDAELIFTSWSSDTIEVHGDYCRVMGHNCTLDVKSTSTGSSIMTSGSTITVEASADNTSIIGSNNTVTDNGTETHDLERLTQHVITTTTTTPLALTSSDLNQVRVIDSTTAVVVDLPSVDTKDVGDWVKIVKVNTGSLTVNAADSDIIADSSAGGTIANTTSEDYATMCLQPVTDTRWVVTGFDGTWTTS